MSTIPSLMDFELLFESSPVWVHEGGWFYGARFVIERGADCLVVLIAPDEAELSLKWLQGERVILELKLLSVTEWHIQRRKGSEQLLTKVSGQRESLCLVTINPTVSVVYEAQW